MPHLLVIGGSDAGISASLRAREIDPSTDVTMVVADAYPNFSICGIPQVHTPVQLTWDPVQMAAHVWMTAWKAHANA